MTSEKIKQYAEEYLVPFAVDFATAIVVFVIGRIVAKLLVRALRRIGTRADWDESLTKFLCDVLYAVLLAIVVIASLERLGVKTTAAVAVLGAMGLAIGLALQGSLGNFASGVMLLVLKPYKVGDVVSIAGQAGKVEAIKIFHTELRTPDNRVITIPNGSVTGGIIENITGESTRRVDMVFGIGYSDDIKLARDVLQRIVSEEPKVLAEPAAQIVVGELADSSVNFYVRPWCKTEDFWDVKFNITERVKSEFDAAGISIPFPQTDVHLHKVDAA